VYYGWLMVRGSSDSGHDVSFLMHIFVSDYVRSRPGLPPRQISA
jgi:hypothetical protein